jgi:hypothetical protein
MLTAGAQDSKKAATLEATTGLKRFNKIEKFHEPRLFELTSHIVGLESAHHLKFWLLLLSTDPLLKLVAPSINPDCLSEKRWPLAPCPQSQENGYYPGGRIALDSTGIWAW